MNTMQLSQNGFKLLCTLEGNSLKPYLDIAKVATIGIGNTFYEDGTEVKMSDPAITLERSFTLAKHVLQAFEQQVNLSILLPMTQNQFDAMVLLCYNIGKSGFAKSSVVKNFNAGLVQKAADSFSPWNKAGGVVSKGLISRRNKERELFLSWAQH